MNPATVTGMFDALIARGGWTGADSTASVPLADGRTLWGFSDTMLGTVNPDGTRARTTPIVHNTLVVQAGTGLTAVVGGTPAAPQAVINPPAPDFAWVSGMVRHATTSLVTVVANTYRSTGTGQLDFALSGTTLANINTVGIGVSGPLMRLSYGPTIAWGAAIVNDQTYTYVFGSEYITNTKQRFAVLGRAPKGRLDQQWRFWTGSTWSTDYRLARRLLVGVGTQFGVQRTTTGWLLVTVDCREPFTPYIVAYTAPTLTGPWTGPTTLYVCPEMTAPDVFVYDARVHPHLADPGQVFVSYNVHSLNGDTLYNDASVYRPRFLSLPA